MIPGEGHEALRKPSHKMHKNDERLYNVQNNTPESLVWVMVVN
jgi:hypothetical protein